MLELGTMDVFGSDLPHFQLDFCQVKLFNFFPGLGVLMRVGECL